MKKIWAAILAALFFASCAPVKLDANRIEIKGRMQASKLSRELKGIHAVYFVTQVGQTSQKKAIYQQGKKIRVDFLFSVGDADYIRGLDTFTGKWGMWKDDTWTGNAETDNYPKEFEVRFSYFPCWFERLGAKTVYIGDEMINGVDCYTLVTEGEKNTMETFYIDKVSLLAVKWKIQNSGEKKENLEYLFSSYKTLGKSFRYAERIEGMVNGKKSLEIGISAMETGLSLDSKIFNAYKVEIMDTLQLEQKIKEQGVSGKRQDSKKTR